MQRYAVIVQGIVQGVGFRPFVYSLAAKYRLAGHVKNHTGTVFIEVEGAEENLQEFLAELANKPPPLAQIDHVSVEERRPKGERDFRIETSESCGETQIFLSPDVATCDACLAELFDPNDRRFGYPFLNCTNCGPRLTIIHAAPYDRQNTSMAHFPLCPACRAEYENPADRRFHAQPTACPECGPQLQIFESEKSNPQRIESAQPLNKLVQALHSGRIGALKGLGGYHFVCDATNAVAVRDLRRRKHRDEKPFAVMVRDIEAAEMLCEIGRAERELLLSPRRPIVLLRKKRRVTVAEEIAPGNPWLGVMLPYTPLHHLLMRAAGMPLVMTSGNCSNEPIAYEDDDALQRLAGIADIYLIHDRPIHVRCDDSVTRIVNGLEYPLRRSRGYAPQPVPLPAPCSIPMLAVGGQLKATFALGRDRHAFVSHHMGDLDHLQAYQSFVRDVELYQQLFTIHPELLVHDLHPDYQSTNYAVQRAADEEIDHLAVQHHHAHMAACMAENDLREPVIGVIFDGAGFGADGAIWGGEFLTGDYRHFQRAAHLRYVGMPGGERAIHEPWRMALAHLVDAGCDTALLEERLSEIQMRTVRQMLERGFNTPMTSSAGRLFDAVAALAGVRDCVSYEGQAAIELEWLALDGKHEGVYPFDLLQPEAKGNESPLIIDTRPLIRRVAEDAHSVEPVTIARRFHSSVVEIVATVCDHIRKQTGLRSVVLSGGVFMNVLLTRETTARLGTDGFQVYQHRLVPANDGGLSLGQLAVAAEQWQPAGNAKLHSSKGAADVSRHSRQGD